MTKNNIALLNLFIDRGSIYREANISLWSIPYKSSFERKLSCGSLIIFTFKILSLRYRIDYFDLSLNENNVNLMNIMKKYNFVPYGYKPMSSINKITGEISGLYQFRICTNLLESCHNNDKLLDYRD